MVKINLIDPSTPLCSRLAISMVGVVVVAAVTPLDPLLVTKPWQLASQSQFLAGSSAWPKASIYSVMGLYPWKVKVTTLSRS